MMPLTSDQTQALFLVVIMGCAEPGKWSPTCTEATSGQDIMGAELLTTVCDQLVNLGLLCDIGGGFLALYHPTAAGVQQVIQCLQAFLAAPPPDGEVWDV